MMKGLNHVGLSVSNLERSIEFYRVVFGLETIAQVIFEDECYDRIFALEGARGRAALLKGANLRVELFEFSNPAPRPKDPNYPVSDHGLSHFCVEVADIDGEYRRLVAAGVYFHCPPLDFFGSAATYGRDPDGNIFELLQMSAAARGEFHGLE